MLGRLVVLAVLTFALVTVFAACGGRGGVSISVAPSEVTLAPGEAQEFTATVQGAGDALVEWSASGGDLVPSGSTAVFTAPVEAGVYTVTARSAQDRGRWATAAVTVADSVSGGAYPYGDAVALSDDVTKLAFDGVRVDIPAVRDGASATVEVAVVDELVGAVMPLTSVTRVVALRFAGELDLAGETDDEPPVLRLTLVPSTSGGEMVSTAGFLGASVLAVAWVRVGGSEWSPLGGLARWDDDDEAFLVSVAHPLDACSSGENLGSVAESCEFAWQVVDAAPLIAAEDATDSGVAVGGLVSRASTMPTATGLYQVDLDAFGAAGAVCDFDRLREFLTHENERASWTRTARTAVVFVHGWMSLAGLMKGLDGDEPLSLPAHCSTWRTFFLGIAGAHGPWASLRANADVFTYRYNSNQRVTHNGDLLAGWLPELQALGYERVVLVGHSMGGLVVHDARERVFADGGSGLGPIDLPVITLATPYMGGPLLCTEVSGGFCTNANTTILSPVWGVVPIAGMPSTLDLSTALDVTPIQRVLMGHAGAFERNPYLLRLWEPVNMRDPFLTAFVGSSDQAPFYTDTMYAASMGLLTVNWFFNDGIVPLASANAGMDLSYTAGRLANVYWYGRDHGFMASGCIEHPLRPCPTGGHIGDPYLDAVAMEMLAYTLIGDGDVSVSISPESVTMEPGGVQQFSATVSGTANTGVSWISTCGSLSAGGNTVKYTAPGTVGWCSLTATSVADPTASSSAAINVRAADSLQPLRNSVAAGVHHTLAILDDQSLWVWGSNYHGQLGVGLDSGLPECTYGTCSTLPIRGPDIGRVISVAAGFEHSVALIEDGTVWTWGWNAMGQLGDGSTLDRDAPTQVPGLTNIVSIGAGSYHSLAVDANGDLWAWGENLHGGLGVDPASGPDSCGANICSTTPLRVAGIQDVVAAHGGDYHTIALTADGSVWGWGFYLGRGDGTTEDRYEPVRLPYLSDVEWIDSAWYTSFAVDTSGAAWIWGESWPCLPDSQLYAPTPLDGLSGVAKMTLVMPQAHCVAATVGTDVLEWGFIDGDSGRVETPRAMADLSDVSVLRTSLMHTIAVTRSGGAFAWGENYYGMLGDGTTTYRGRPVQVNLPRPVWRD